MYGKKVNKKRYTDLKVEVGIGSYKLNSLSKTV